MDASELLKRYAAGERDFFGVKLSDSDLSKTDLSEVCLSEADLSETDLGYTYLIQAHLRSANLSGAFLHGAYKNLVERQVERRLIANQGTKAKKKINLGRNAFQI